ncbi:MAG: N-acetyl-gamma-glutamyl-phosphate reductase [Clostridia bacterium]|nr:N-acetyl-gamma-glutamyl-phosphate reductase [Clostridia bacterium]
MSKKTKIFIDGREGTTGLKILERFAGRDDLELIDIPDELRKDPAARAERLNAADIAFLCLPDAAAREAVAMVTNPNTKIIDASTAHRTMDGWAYGFPELSPAHRAAIVSGKRVAVPGCHASGFLSLVYPLRAAGILPADYPIVSYSLTGYTGGGKKMIAEYEGEGRDIALDSPRQYGLTQQHKHLPEMQAVASLAHPPIFAPIVADFPQGMEVSVPLYSALLNGKPTPADVHAALSAHYAGSKMVSVLPLGGDGTGFLPSNPLAGKCTMQIFVGGNNDRILLCSLFDNLGKGASGAAVQCMNIMLGVEEDLGL